MVGVAVNVYDSPMQEGFDPEVIAVDTAGVIVPLDVIIVELDVAVVGLAQLKLEVITHDIVWPLVKTEVNVALFVPTFAPSTCH